MCVGEYTVQTDDVRTHISCSAYTAPTLACIAEGISELLISFVVVVDDDVVEIVVVVENF